MPQPHGRERGRHRQRDDPGESDRSRQRGDPDRGQRDRAPGPERPAPRHRDARRRALAGLFARLVAGLFRGLAGRAAAAARANDDRAQLRPLVRLADSPALARGQVVGGATRMAASIPDSSASSGGPNGPSAGCTCDGPASIVPSSHGA